jgi:hypothetical protein
VAVARPALRCNSPSLTNCGYEELGNALGLTPETRNVEPIATPERRDGDEHA